MMQGGDTQGAAEPLSAQPRAQHLVAQRLGGAGRAPLVLHALHARQAGVGLLHHRDLAGLRVVVGFAPVGEVDGVLGAAGEDTVLSAHPVPCQGAAGSAGWLPSLPRCLPGQLGQAGSPAPGILLLSSQLAPPPSAPRWAPTHLCPLSPPGPVTPQPPGILTFSPQRLQPPDPGDHLPATGVEVPWQGSTTTPSAPQPLTHVSQQPTPMGCRQVQSRQLVLSHDSPRENFFPSYSQGAAEEMVAMRIPGPQVSSPGRVPPQARACGSLLGTPLSPKRGQEGPNDLPPAPWYRRYLGGLSITLQVWGTQVMLPPILSWLCPAGRPGQVALASLESAYSAPLGV